MIRTSPFRPSLDPHAQIENRHGAEFAFEGGQSLALSIHARRRLSKCNPRSIANYLKSIALRLAHILSVKEIPFLQEGDLCNPDMAPVTERAFPRGREFLNIQDQAPL